MQQFNATRRLTDRLCSRHYLAFLLMVLMIMITGCGKSRDLAPLTGKVTYNGQPLQFGVVMIQGKGGQPATGKIQSDGSFTLVTRGEGDGVPVGENKVKVLCYEGQNPEVLEKNPRTQLGSPLIPARYLTYRTSGITVNIKPEGNEPLVLNLTN